MMRKTLYLFFGLSILTLSCFADQISVSRIEKMPNLPSPYYMRDWKSVAKAYDKLVFDEGRVGDYLPLIHVRQQGNNYPASKQIRMDTYVGAKSHGIQAEGINILPAIVGATLVGIDKTSDNGENYVSYAKDFFNKKNGQNVYLNGYSSTSGNDWWYDLMPNVFFYQLYSLYPDTDADFKAQFIKVADRWLDAVYKLGGSLQPWTVPNMNHRAFNLATGKPLTNGAKEPESAGTIAWLLYQAYVQTGEKKYFEGAQLALEFLCTFGENPSYELQLPYGTLIAARMNAEQDCSFNIDRLINWCFDWGRTRGWGAIVGKWGGYDVSGLIGEANDNGNDYAFVMNGFQQAAALAPIVKYDKRYARAIGKWLLNIANASRLFYNNVLPADHQEPQSYNWSSVYDTESCIPYESMKEVWDNKSPYIMGDATGGGWAATNISLYSGSSVGYLAGLIERTNIEGILQIDVNRTDFFGDAAYPVYLYYNPYTENKTVEMELPSGEYDLYDAISERDIVTRTSGIASFTIPADGVCLLTVLPTGSERVISGHRLLVNNRIVDFYFGYDYSRNLRMKAMVADPEFTTPGSTVKFNVYADNIPLGSSVVYQWSVNGEVIQNAGTGSYLNWTAPSIPGCYVVKVVGSARNQTISGEVNVEVLERIYDKPSITSIETDSPMPLLSGETIDVISVLREETPGLTVLWECDGGSMEVLSDLSRRWKLPSVPGVYTISCKAENRFGEDMKSLEVLVKEEKSPIKIPLIYYPLNGDCFNAANFGIYDAVQINGSFVDDVLGRKSSAYFLSSSSDLLYTANDGVLGFQDKVTIGFWVSPNSKPGREQFLISHGSWEERYKVSLSPDMTLRWTVNTSDGTKDLDYKIPFELNKFYYVTAVYTGYSMELYINGAFYSFIKHSGSIGTTDKDITYGRKDRTDTEYIFTGVLDEIRIYNDELSLSELRELPETWVLCPSSVETVVSESRIGVLKNPGMLHVTTGEVGLESMEIFDMQGIRIPCKWWGESEYSYVVLTGELSPAVYILRLTDNSGKSYMYKFVL
ncbi:LamG domain-containing protein [Coprobacter sp.]